MIYIKNVKSDYIYLIWKNPQTRRRYHVGILKKNEKNYEYRYVDNIDEIIKIGFHLLVSFPEIKKKYISKELFPEFLTRIPGPTRVDIKNILNKYNMIKYDEFELLKRSGAKTSLDTLEFIDPILNIKDTNIIREFHIAGTRYYCKCQEESIDIGDLVILKKEIGNQYDIYAVQMYIKEKFVGYIPAYYSEIITKFLNSKNAENYKCVVVNKTYNCEECLKVKLYLNYNEDKMNKE